MVKTKETWETKLVWGFARLVKNILRGGNSKTNRQNSGKLDRALVVERWREINLSLKQTGPAHYQSAVINADKLLDYCLKGFDARGETMGERLKNSQNLFHDRVSYQAAWDGHKLRNTLVHDHDTEILFYQARGAIEQFRKALEGLRIL